MSAENMPEESLLSVLQADIDMRGKEVSLRQHEMTSNQQIALASIEANKEVELNRKQAFEFMIGRRYSLLKLVTVSIGIIAIVGMYLNKDAVVIDMFKTILGFGGIAFGAYQYGKNQDKKQ